MSVDRPWIEAISKLSVKPGDVVVLSTDLKLSPEQTASVKEMISHDLPLGSKVTVLSHGVKIHVLSIPEPLTESEIADLWLSSSVRHVRSGHASKAVVEDFARSIERRKSGEVST